MMDESTEERAVLYVFGLLDAEEARVLEKEIRENAELGRFVREMENIAASLAQCVEPRTPPAELKRRLMAEIQRGKIVTMPAPARWSNSWAPWAVAACLALLAGSLAIDRARLKEQVAMMADEDALSRVKIATLSSMLDSAPKGSAVVVWNEEKQEGIIKVENMPAARADQDYQLWVIDPGYKLPVNAGVFHPEGSEKRMFKPTAMITSPAKFAVTIERKGGAPHNEGPIVLVSK